MDRTAEISDCGKYRYSLYRIWNTDSPVVTWIMLNPSTADADVDDPTIRRCVGFAKKWGFGGIRVVNLFALRATNPAELKTAGMALAIGHNLGQIIALGDMDGPKIAAWGANPMAVNWCKLHMDLLPPNLMCLGTTKAGAPRHPLYVKGDMKLEMWNGYVENVTKSPASDLS